MILTGSEIIAECLLEQGVDTVFGYPGGAVLNIYDALYMYSGKIRHIMTAHEQGAAHAADGYARATGKTGVVIATSGPGATNLITGIASAYMDSSPVVAITGNVSRNLLGKDSFQEVNIKEIARPVTKASFQIMSMEELAPTIRKAFEIAQSGRKGPVLIDVPKDITALKTEYEKYAPQKPEECLQTDEQAVCKAAELINNAKRPLIYAGGGIISSQAGDELTAFAEKIDAPVCCSVMGIGGISTKHPLYIGNIGMHGAYETGMATKNADLIIALGARFSDRVAGDPEKFRQNCNIIHIDIDKKEIDKNVKTDNYILGDVKNVLSKLTDAVSDGEHRSWLEQIKQWKNEIPPIIDYEQSPPTPQYILRTLNGFKNAEDIITTDVGQHQMWVAQECVFEKPRTFLTSGGLGTMGFGLGAAIGAATAKPQSRVTLVTGDGSFHMNLNELVTLKSYNIPIVVIVMNNSVLGMVRQWQKLFYGGRFSQTDPHRATSFEKLANAFGIEGITVNRHEQVLPALEKAYGMNAPVVIDCHISPDENVLPMIPPGKTADEMILELW
ncbi:MAG: biosynthetic-type acetolactate synthase large subunit [Acutalibacteraceae bacterium]